jgi:acetolactate synthase I/II/III large subunit
MTGKAGVAIVTSGPGVSNTATGLATANSEGDPVVVLGGAVSVADRLKSVHQTMDSVELCRPITKYAAEIDSPSATAEVLSAAFRAAEGDRPGSAFVSLPADIATEEAKCRAIRPSEYVSRFGMSTKLPLCSRKRSISLVQYSSKYTSIIEIMPSFLNTCTKHCVNRGKILRGEV